MTFDMNLFILQQTPTFEVVFAKLKINIKIMLRSILFLQAIIFVTKIEFMLVLGCEGWNVRSLFVTLLWE